MKRIFTTITLLAMIIFAGCTDLDDIYRQLDEQKKDLANVKQLINATTNKLSVVSYKELDDKSGYELSMSDGSKIILKHGAQGEPGEQGKPGEPGAPGPDGDANLTITETDDAIIITYMGVTYTLPKAPPINPLSLVAEYNVNPEGTGFVTSLTACNVSGYFTFDDAVDKFTPSITISGKKYHLPSREEWQSIVPLSAVHVQFTNTESHDDISETVTVQGTSITMTSDFRTGVNKVSYALRYKGTDLVSAWRYEYISDGNNTHIKVTSRSLKGQTVVTVDEIAKTEFWSANGDNDVTRHFPASGYFYSGSLNSVDTHGYFWSSSPRGSNAWIMGFGSSYASSGGSHRDHGLSVRLFASGD
ncbi:MAG TPA: collagen-like protein [Petrimonas sp.]|jgi:hypothetical protein|nr:collagen-like protein [Petrimonas sp.]